MPPDKEDKIIVSPGIKRRESINKDVKNILITMGGSDPDNATEKVLDALRGYEKLGDKSVIVVLGPMFRNKGEITKLSKKIKAREVRVLENVEDMPDLIKMADVGITSAGMTMREMILSGLPCISIAVSERQIPNTIAVGKNGFSIDLGRSTELKKEDVINALLRLENFEERENIYENQGNYKPDNEKILDEIAERLIP